MARPPDAPEYTMQTGDPMETTPMMMTGGKFAEMGKDVSKIKYNRATGSTHYWIQFSADILDKLFTVVIAAFAIWQMTDLTNEHFAYQTWQDLIITRAGATLALTLWWTVAEAINKKARDRGTAELPCPERLSTLTWYWYIFAWWVVAMAFYSSFYADHTAVDTQTQDASFNIKMVLILFAAYTDLLDYVRWLLRVPEDKILISCGSTCYGC
jgi:hypothetical protein